MKSFKALLWALVATLVLNGAAYAQAGVTLTYQGTLNDAGGQAINASRAMTFCTDVPPDGCPQRPRETACGSAQLSTRKSRRPPSTPLELE